MNISKAKEQNKEPDGTVLGGGSIRMFRSETRILTTHAGALPRSAELTRLVLAKAAGEEKELDNLKMKLRSEVAEIVHMQSQCGVDIVNDGELSKTSITFARALPTRMSPAPSCPPIRRAP